VLLLRLLLLRLLFSMDSVGIITLIIGFRWDIILLMGAVRIILLMGAVGIS